MSEPSKIEESLMTLVELGGRTAQEFGVGRVLGQILALLYFSEEEQSLDAIEQRLQLSKAAVSIASRDLEKLGLVQRVWKPNDRRSYYRSVENLGQALRHGVLQQIDSSMRDVEHVLTQVREQLDGSEPEEDAGTRDFLSSRINRAEELQQRTKRLLHSPLIKMLVR